MMGALIVGALLFASATPSAAQTAPTPVPPADQTYEKMLADFLAKNPRCTDFNDGCSICAVKDGLISCSTPQIACIKHENQCTRSTPE